MFLFVLHLCCTTLNLQDTLLKDTQSFGFQPYLIALSDMMQVNSDIRKLKNNPKSLKWYLITALGLFLIYFILTKTHISQS